MTLARGRAWGAMGLGLLGGALYGLAARLIFDGMSPWAESTSTS